MTPFKTSQKKIFVSEMIGVSLLTSRIGIPFISMFVSPLILYFAGWKSFIQFTIYSFAIYALFNPLQLILVFTATGASASALTTNVRETLQQTVTTAYANPALVQQSLNNLMTAMYTLLAFDLLTLAGFVTFFAVIYYYIKRRLSHQISWSLSGHNR